MPTHVGACVAPTRLRACRAFFLLIALVSPCGQSLTASRRRATTHASCPSRLVGLHVLVPFVGAGAWLALGRTRSSALPAATGAPGSSGTTRRERGRNQSPRTTIPTSCAASTRAMPSTSGCCAAGKRPQATRGRPGGEMRRAPTASHGVTTNAAVMTIPPPANLQSKRSRVRITLRELGTL